MSTNLLGMAAPGIGGYSRLLDSKEHWKPRQLAETLLGTCHLAKRHGVTTQRFDLRISGRFEPVIAEGWNEMGEWGCLQHFSQYESQA